MALITTGTAGSAGGSSVVLTQSFSMTAQEIKDSMLTPHTILSAQGAGTLVTPLAYVFNYVPGVVAYNGDIIDLVWGGLDLNKVFGGLLSLEGFAGWSLSTFSAGFSEGGPQADYLNKPVQFAANLRGSIVSATVGFSSGSGYAVGDTGTIDDGTPNATYIVTAETGGNVNAFTVVSAGGDYGLAAGRTYTEWTTTPGGSQPGAGTGLTVLVTEVDASASVGDGTLAGVIYYVVTDLT